MRPNRAIARRRCFKPRWGEEGDEESRSRFRPARVLKLKPSPRRGHGVRANDVQSVSHGAIVRISPVQRNAIGASGARRGQEAPNGGRRGRLEARRGRRTRDSGCEGRGHLEARRGAGAPRGGALRGAGAGRFGAGRGREGRGAPRSGAGTRRARDARREGRETAGCIVNCAVAREPNDRAQAHVGDAAELSSAIPPPRYRWPASSTPRTEALRIRAPPRANRRGRAAAVRDRARSQAAPC